MSLPEVFFMTENRIPTDTELLFPEREFDYYGLTVVVRALPGRKVLRLLEAFTAISRLTRRSAQDNEKPGRASLVEVLAACWNDVLRLLDQSVEIRGLSEQRSVLDLPFKIFPDLLHAFFELNFDVGKWQALGRALGLGPLAKRLIESMTSTAATRGAADS
jgi:hypothetical protein